MRVLGNPLVRVTLAPGLPSFLVNRALERTTLTDFHLFRPLNVDCINIIMIYFTIDILFFSAL